MGKIGKSQKNLRKVESVQTGKYKLGKYENVKLKKLTRKWDNKDNNEIYQDLYSGLYHYRWSLDVR